MREVAIPTLDGKRRRRMGHPVVEGALQHTVVGTDAGASGIPGPG